MVKVGDVFYTGHRGKVEAVTVSKVGRKYFELEEYRRQKFDVTSKKDTASHNYPVRLYTSEQELLDEREATVLKDKIGRFFNNYYFKLSLPQMRRINDIINE